MVTAWSDAYSMTPGFRKIPFKNGGTSPLAFETPYAYSVTPMKRTIKFYGTQIKLEQSPVGVRHWQVYDTARSLAC